MSQGWFIFCSCSKVYDPPTMLSLVNRPVAPLPDDSKGAVERSILLVDDNDDLRGTTADLLRDRGFLVMAAADASTARRLWHAEGGANALITDLRMPGEDGLELAKSLRGERGDLPVLLISSHLDPGMSERLERRDMAFRSKPFSIKTLVAGLDEARDRAESGADRRPSNGRVGRDTGRNRLVWMPRAAALTVVAIGIGWFFASVGPPALPDVDTSTARRSFRVEPLTPRGVQQVVPEQLRWREVEGADRYQVTLLRPGDEVAWRGESVHSPLALPATLEIAQATRYIWRVEAVDRNGDRIAWSEAASFWLEPSGAEVMEE